jgi:hypothetical protein
MNLNLKLNPEIVQLKELISNCDDDNFNHIIWVAKNGNVHIYATILSNPDSAFEKENGKNLQFWKGVYLMGNQYFGIEASNDTKYMQGLLDTLIKNWGKKTYGHIDD